MGVPTTNDAGPTAVDYVLGHTPGELERLERQAELLRPITHRTLLGAGIKPGMRVLDLGTGTGDVARLAAELVGPTGSVVGIDRSEAALGLASGLSTGRGLTNVAFVAGDLHAAMLDGPFDAVVGRFVLMHLADPIAAVRQAAALVRPGGALAFVEPVCPDPTPTTEEAPLIRRTAQLIRDGLGLAGCDMAFGLRLSSILTAAGLPAPQLISEGIVVSAADPSRFEWPVQTLRSLLPVLEGARVTTGAEIGIDTLAGRLTAEAVRTGCVAMPMVAFGCWAQTPDS